MWKSSCMLASVLSISTTCSAGMTPPGRIPDLFILEPVQSVSLSPEILTSQLGSSREEDYTQPTVEGNLLDRGDDHGGR